MTFTFNSGGLGKALATGCTYQILDQDFKLLRALGARLRAIHTLG